MADRSRSRRSPARYLAPLALAATIAGIYLVAESALHTTPKHRAAPPVSAPRHRAARRGAARGGAARRQTAAAGGFYKVRPGDSLSVIAARTGVPVASLLTLNPGVSPSSLQIGQRLRLRR
jgi:Tfp pilus assembly protein FimV